MPTMSARWKSYFFLLINTICWGSTFAVVKPALDYTTPTLLLFYRYCIAVILTIPIMMHYWRKLKNPRTVLLTVLPIELMGTSLALALLYIGLDLTTALEANLIATTQPLFVTLIGIVFLREKLERHELVGTTIAFLATLYLTIRPLTDAHAFNWSMQQGNLFVLVSTVLSALYVIFIKRWYRPYPKLFLSALGFRIAFVSFLLMSLAETGFSFSHWWSAIQADLSMPVVLWAAVFMAVFTSLIGLTAYIKGQDTIEASEASLFWYLQPLVYIPLGMYLLNEQIHLSEIIALGVILLGVALAEKRFRRKPLPRLRAQPKVKQAVGRLARKTRR